MNLFDKLSTEMHYNIFSLLPKEEISGLQAVSQDFNLLAADDSLWEKPLKKMCVTIQSNYVKNQVTSLYRSYIQHLKESFKLDLKNKNIFKTKKEINFFILKHSESESMYFRLTSIFNFVIRHNQHFIPPLIFPLIAEEWKHYVLTEAIKTSCTFVPNLIKMGALPNEYSFSLAIRNCPQYVPSMLCSEFKPNKEHLKIALLHSPELIPTLLKQGASPKH